MPTIKAVKTARCWQRARGRWRARPRRWATPAVFWIVHTGTHHAAKRIFNHLMPDHHATEQVRDVSAGGPGSVRPALAMFLSAKRRFVTFKDFYASQLGAGVAFAKITRRGKVITQLALILRGRLAGGMYKSIKRPSNYGHAPPSLANGDSTQLSHPPGVGERVGDRETAANTPPATAATCKQHYSQIWLHLWGSRRHVHRAGRDSVNPGHRGSFQAAPSLGGGGLPPGAWTLQRRAPCGR